jgi:2-oxoglutarate dehydrogenase complex dehydrogenase (E1) component-like enzyme
VCCSTCCEFCRNGFVGLNGLSELPEHGRVQEEPFNQGCWGYVEPRIVTAIKDFAPGKRPFFVGRNAAASPATGSPSIHKAEMEKFLNDAFSAEYKHEEWVWKLSELQKKD